MNISFSSPEPNHSALLQKGSINPASNRPALSIASGNLSDSNRLDSADIRFGNRGGNRKRPWLAPLMTLILASGGMAGARYLGSDTPTTNVQPVEVQTADGKKAEEKPLFEEETGPKVKSVPLSKVDEVLERVKAGKIVKAELTKDGTIVFTRIDGKEITLRRPTDEDEDLRLREGIKPIILVTKMPDSSTGKTVLGLFVGFAPILLILYILGRSKNKMIPSTESQHKKALSSVRLSDVRGNPEAVKEAQSIINIINNRKANHVGAKLPKGVLMVGPPGTGKTLLAKAIAGECGVPFLEENGPEFVEMFVGRGAARVRDLFEKAKKQAPCIIFIDEIDAVGCNRGDVATNGKQEAAQTLNQLLIEMDGFDGNDEIMVLAATNRVDVLDPALTRSGRFDTEIYVPLPRESWQRRDILEKHLESKQAGNALASDVRIEKLADMTPGFSGADLENMVNQAAMTAFQRGATKISMKDFEEAALKMRLGLKQSNLTQEKERRKVAVHELAGHALVWLANPGEKLKRVSMIPRGTSLGHVEPDASTISETLPSYNDFLKMILLSMGGRAAEKALLEPGEFTPGAQNDLEKAREHIKKMLASAMFEGHYPSSDLASGRGLSSKEEAVVNRVLAEAEKTCREIIEKAEPGQLMTMIEKALSAGDDYVGEEANHLFSMHLGEDFSWESLYKITERFKQDPFGNWREKENPSAQKPAK